MLDIVEDFMTLRGYRCEFTHLSASTGLLSCLFSPATVGRFDGSTPRPRRSLGIRLFQQADEPYDVFLISTRAVSALWISSIIIESYLCLLVGAVGWVGYQLDRGINCHHDGPGLESSSKLLFLSRPSEFEDWKSFFFFFFFSG